ncbi:MAG: hypothetical protein P4L35_10665 [Ignavibacteriaceae bacterium]|nr:hypothetical protein [Ignavibacteriaceae bacterium]
MKSFFLILISLFFSAKSYSQVPILYYDFENNTTRTIFENLVEQAINPGSGPITRVGSGTIDSGIGNDNAGTGVYSSKWQNVTTDPGIAATEYFQFSVNTTNFKGISVRFRYTVPFQTGPGNVGILISSNGTTFKKVGSFAGGANVGWGDLGYSFYSYPEVNNLSNLTIRIYAFKGINTGTGGYMGLDNLMITADTVLSNAGNITLLDESSIYSSYYSGGIGKILFHYCLTINGPGTKVSLSSQIDIAQSLTVNNGANLDCGIYPVWGLGNFILNNGGTLSIGSPLGIALSPDSSGNICVKGTRTYNSAANYIYNGTSPQNTGNGLPPSLNCLSINNITGISLTNSLQVIDTLKLLLGNLFLRTRNLSLRDTTVIFGASSGSYVVTDNSGAMIFDNLLRNSDIKIPVGTADSFNPVIINYTGTVDTFKVAVKPAFDNPPVINNKVVNRQWNISENNIGGSVASLKFCWIVANEASAFNPASPLIVGRYDGLKWYEVPASVSGSGTNADPYIASVSGITEFFPFGVGNDGALPVELIAFYGEQNKTNISLHWNTATEINSNSFNIERKELSSDTWLKIGSVHANFLSNSPKSYSFADKNVNPGIYQYRLKMIDNDGSFIYSKVVELKAKLTFGLELSQNYPNPFNPSTRINYKVPYDAHILIEVFNVLGIKVASLVNEIQCEGFHNVDFVPSRDHNSISSGIYYYSITATDLKSGLSNNLTKKMILLK